MITNINSYRKKMRTGQSARLAALAKMRAGSAACGTDCPPGAGPFTMQDLARFQGRRVPGASGECTEMILPLSGTIAEDGLETDLTVVSSPVGLCINSIVAFTDPDAAGGPAYWSNLTVRNSPQWIIGEEYDEMLFAPDAECSCCLPGDCIEVGASVSVHVRISAAAPAAGQFVALYLIGTSLS